MENQLWNLFLETGDPMGYLLYRAGQNSEAPETEQRQDTERKTLPAGNLPAAF